jgi:hypothetical protein
MVGADGRQSAGLAAWQAAALLFAAGALVALTETRDPTITGHPAPLADAARLAAGLLVVFGVFAVADRFWALPWRRPALSIAAAFFGCLAAEWLGGVSFPNSGDEYAYVFMADTLRAGRLWDAAPPDALLFASSHLAVRDGITFAPYPPAWSALLVPFRALGAGWLANPLLTALLGTALAGSCRRLQLTPIVQKSALALVLLIPFTLFLGGSLFPQTMAATLVAGIVWVQLVDEASPRPWRKLLIGALFGILLLVRYDVFPIVALLYAIDRLVVRRLAAITDGLLVLLGFLPFAACLAAYNAGITGNPFRLTSPDVLNEPAEGAGAGPLMKSASRTLYWLGNLAEFGGLPILVLAAVALVVKIRQRTCRFYDFLLPVAVTFYAAQPFAGGHQYGPRYWFWAWSLAMLTVASGLVDPTGDLRIAGRRVAFERFAAACLVYAAGAFCVLLVTTHIYMAARHAVFDNRPPPDVRAIVLVPSRSLQIWPMQGGGLSAWSPEFTHNDIDYSGQVLYGRADLPDAVQRACRLEGREVFRWEEPGRLVRVVCP